eukprot:365764-Chlamydomonas_euryale.AAC.3
MEVVERANPMRSACTAQVRGSGIGRDDRELGTTASLPPGTSPSHARSHARLAHGRLMGLGGSREAHGLRWLTGIHAPHACMHTRG